MGPSGNAAAVGVVKNLELAEYEMILRPIVSCVAVCAVAMTLTSTVSLSAPGNTRSNSLRGGTDEWGGRRQSVKFNPKYPAGQVVVSFGDRRLYLVTAPGQAISYPIAVPREDARWEGDTNVSMKRENPSWTPTPSMVRANPKLPSWVPGGHPMNPLGVRALYLGSSTYRIHGTDAPWTIGEAVSAGCIRMYNEDVLDLYPRVPVGSKVVVTWQEMGKEVATAPQDSPRRAPARTAVTW